MKLSYTPGDEEVRLLYGDGVVDGSHAYERESTKWHTFAESLASSLGGSDETDAIEQRPDSRQIQDSEEEYPTRHAMVFDNCLFIHNSAGTTNKDIHYGVIYAQTETIDLVVNNSLFVENVFVGENVVVSQNSSQL